MNPVQEHHRICSLMQEKVMPSILEYKQESSNVDGTLWYVCDEGTSSCVVGPIDFHKSFFEDMGYSDEAIREVLSLLIKAKKESGVVISFNFCDRNGNNRTKNTRIIC